MLTNIKELAPENLLNEVAACRLQGYRWVTISCTDLGPAYDLLYHFDLDYELLNLRLQLPKGRELPSVSKVYLAAAIVENEIKDLFGISFTGLALDYEGRFLLTEDAPRAPMSKQDLADDQAEEKVNENG